MFMSASTVVNSGDGGKMLASSTDILFFLAKEDLFSECLVEALDKKFPLCHVVSTPQKERLGEMAGGKVRLSLLYKIPPAELYDTVRFIRGRYPSAPVALAMDVGDLADSHLALLVKSRMIDGVLPLNLRMDVFMAVIDLLMKGGEHFPSALLSKLRPAASGLGADSRGDTLHVAAPALSRHEETHPLTTREIQILDLLCTGTQNKVIAERLNLSENTVKAHVRNIYKKMNVRNRTEAVSRFFQIDSGEEPPNGLRN